MYRRKEMVGTLSKQINSAQEGTLRLTRTERRKQYFQTKQQEQQFSDLQRQAEQIQKEKASQIKTQQDYENFYSSLSPDIQQFFLTPQEVAVQKQQRIQTTIGQVQDKISELKQKENQKRADVDEYLRQEHNPEIRRDTLNKLDQDVAYYEGQIDALQEARYKLEGGSDLAFNDIIAFAQDKGTYERRKEQGSQKSQEQQRKIDELIQQGYTPELIQEFSSGSKAPTKSTLYFYNQSENKYAQLSVPLTQTSVSGLQSSSALPKAQVVQQYTFGGKTFNISTTEPVYKTSMGQLTTVYGTLGKSESQILAERDAQEKELDKQAAAYLESSGFKTSTENIPTKTNESFLGKIFTGLKSLYVASPFGASTPLPEEYNIKRETGAGKYLDLLTLKEAYQGIEAEKLKEARGQYQANLIKELSTVTENAPEDLQYYVQAQGLSLLARTGVRSTASTNEEGVLTFTSSDLNPSKSFNLYQFERENEKSSGVTFSKVLLGTRIVSTEALKLYGIGKVIGLAVEGGAAIYEGVGGGLKYTDLSVRGGQVYATVTATGGSKAAQVVSTIGKVGLGLGLAGVYGYEKVKEYEYTKSAFGKTGTTVFFLETGGELGGIGTLVGEGILVRKSEKALQERILQENYIQQSRAAELRNIRDFGQVSEGAVLSYRQVGLGQLSEKGIGQLSGQLAKVTGLTEDEAATLLREKGLYEQVFKIKSNVPSYSRLLQYIRTGKASTSTENIFSTGRYGVYDLVRQGDLSKEIGIEFKIGKGGVPRNILLKVIEARGRFAVTNVFEKGRYKPTAPLEELRLRESVITKLTGRKEGIYSLDLGEAKVNVFELENRLLKYRAYGKERLTVAEALKLGNAGYSEKQLANLFEKVGKVGKSSVFANYRIEVPRTKEFEEGGIKVKSLLEGKYISYQEGIGKRGLPTKNLRFDLVGKILQKLKESELRSALLKQRRARGETLGGYLKDAAIEKEILADTKSAVSFEEKTSAVTLKGLQVSPSVQTAENIRVVENLKEVPSVRSAVKVSEVGAVALRLRQISLLKDELGERSQQKFRQVQNTDQLLKELQKQETRLREAQSPQLSVPNVSLTTVLPNITTTATPIRERAEPKPSFILASLEKKIKIKRSKRRTTIREFLYTPDFVSRALGLEPITITSEAQAEKLLRKIQTGLEIRRGVRLKIPR